MAFISRLINKRITNLITRFDVPKVPPHFAEKIVIDNDLAEHDKKVTNVKQECYL